MDNMFELATRSKLRIPTPRGNLSVEDLWDLSRGDLDATYRGLAAADKDAATEGLIKTRPTAAQRKIAIALEVVKRVFVVLVAERAEREAAAERKEKRQKIMALIAEKKDEGLKALDVAELEKQLAAMDG